jgi:hypothetical protein
MRSIWVAVFSLVLISEGQAAWAAEAAEHSEYHVSGIRPKFFLHESGDLEAEEASRAGGSNMMVRAEALLILVDLAGPRFPIGKGGSLDIVVTSGKTRLYHRWQSLEQNYVSDSGRVTLPFLVYGVACEPIKILATLAASGKRKTRTMVIPLGCGE